MNCSNRKHNREFFLRKKLLSNSFLFNSNFIFSSSYFCKTRILYNTKLKFFRMRKCLLLLSFLCFSAAAFAQIDGADECSTAISLGVAPTCPSTTVYTNENSTASVLPFDNTPTCFSTIPDNDVWFTFTTPADGSIVDFTLQLFSFVDNGNGILNPQIAVYRIDGSCDELAEYDCLSSPDGTSNTSFDLVGLTPGETYYLRVNDYSATGTPNSGEFTLCVSEFIPFFNLCETDASTSCFGTLYDSGGPDGDYSANENCTFTICPSEFHECIAFDLISYNIENNFDNLIFYAGDNVAAPVISTISGSGNGNPFEIEGGSDCITIQMTTDGSGQQEGFELTWQCSSLNCNSSEDDITVIPNLPYDSDNLTTCDNSATFQGTACGIQDFMAGPEAIFTYTTEGGLEDCYSIQVTGAAAGTGILVLDGPPSDPASVCVGTAATGNLGSVNFSAAGTYYIIIANGDGCTEFDINIQPSSCVLDPSLEASLCNPLNGCQNEDGLPSIFSFNTEFFVDVEIDDSNNNNGCWGGIGAGNFYWFTIQAATDGPFGFTFQAADPAEASDIDFNVWGPFTNDQVCGAPQDVIDIIGSTQPLASSYAGGTEPTGLIDIHPTTGTVQDEFYDCNGVGATNNDDFVSSIPTTEGEVYVVLVNDWGGQILSGTVQVDFESTGEGVLDPIDQLIEIDVEAAEVCQGIPVQLSVETASNNILWSPAESLSCSDCPNPIATPTETTEYVVTIDGVCVDAIGTATVNVYDADAGPDQSVCLGEQIEIVGGQFFAQGTYLWEGEAGTISDVTSPSPTITAEAAGVYTYSVTLTTAGCTITDEMTLTVLPTDAAVYQVADDMETCSGETVNIGGPESASTNYVWTSEPIGFTSVDADPEVSPTETTVYYLAASNAVSGCLFPSIDSVTVIVSDPFTLNANPDIAVCQGDTVVLSTLEPEDDVTYSWSPATGIIGGDATIPNVSANPQTTTTYVLSAFRGACEEEISTTVTVSQISIVTNQPDSLELCLGEEVQIEATALPAGIEVNWAPTAGLNPATGASLTATPTVPTLYIATVEVPGCIRMDSLFIQVDSLPADMNIMPQDTTVCEGEIVILQSPIYEPANFPNITHLWTPDMTFESDDTLYNMVVSVIDTIIFIRETVNGACEQTDMTTVNVQKVTELVVTPQEQMICGGDTVQLMVTSDDPNITEFEWDDQFPGLSCYDCPDPIATPSSTTTYTVEGETGLECKPMGMVTIEVLEKPIAPRGRAYCEAGIVPINNGGSMDASYTYLWTNASGFSSTEANPTFNLQETTTFTYSIANQDCPAVEGEVTYSIAADESVVITGDESICAGETTQLTAESSSGFGGFVWSSNVLNSDGSTADVNATGSYEVTYTPDPGCPDVIFTDVFQVTVFEFPIIDSTSMSDTTNCVFEGQSFDLFIESNATTVSWTDQAGNLLGTTPTITTSAPDLIESSEEVQTVDWSYTVTAANEIGCEVSSTIDICVKNALFNVPNVFTPNGDEMNSTFAPVAGETIVISTFEVYNRWGQKVFDAEESGLDAWDGMFNDKPVPADVYAFVIRYTDGAAGELTWRGDVTLVR